MYLYDDIDQRLVDERVAQFRDQTRRFLDGQLSEDDFRAAAAAQRPLRAALCADAAHRYSVWSFVFKAIKKTGGYRARDYDRGYGHFSTRQNLQLNWPKLEEVPEILAELATVQMHAIQTSGNCVRNITTDHFAGVAQDEIVDSFVWCELIRQWSTFHPEFNYLPRKFKIAVNGAVADRAATFVHDIGLHAVKKDGEVGFKVIVGGGLGRTPIVGAGDPRVPALAAPADLSRRDPARLQPPRPARQHPQGAHQDPGQGARRWRSSATKSKPNGRSSRTARRP